ncbi:MAG: HAD family hydrolase, partial [Chitinophagaceae bacterium]|nr:HAD family hydrolase [Chitinophagaceae bacterium]
MTNEQNFQGQIDNSWTLFLDRDGVINEENVGSYITSVEEFKFYKGSLKSLRLLNDIFGRIVVVTNQRGVGKGIMSLEDLKEIHQHMTAKVADEGGRIDKIYACTALDDNDHNRKPNTGMAMQATNDYPEIDLKRSIMVGNNLSDMEFGKKAGMRTVFLTSTHKAYDLPHDLIDEQFPSLHH